MQIYGLKTCDKCRKALKSLPNAEFSDVRTEGVPRAVLEQALREFGAELVNKRSTTWRGLSESDRKLPPAELILAHPTVMKRPLIVAGAALWLGWDAHTRGTLGVA